MSKSVFGDVRPLPVNLRLEGKPVLVVGAGAVALRKVGQLLAAGAEVTVVGPRIDPNLFALPVRVLARNYRRGEVADYSLAITCTDDPAVNAAVHEDGAAARVWVNSADDPQNCEFTLMSVVRQGDLQLTISTEGRSPALAMWLRQRFEQTFTPEWADLLDFLSSERDLVRAELGTSEILGWTDALENGLFELVADGEYGEARRLLHAHLSQNVSGVTR